MPKLVCVACERQFRIKKNGVTVVDMFQEPPVPYEAYMGDMWECPSCGIEVVAGFAQRPMATHYDGHKMQRIADSSHVIVKNYERAS